MIKTKVAFNQPITAI